MLRMPDRTTYASTPYSGQVVGEAPMSDRKRDRSDALPRTTREHMIEGINRGLGAGLALVIVAIAAGCLVLRLILGLLGI